MSNITKAIIPIAGMGTRMHPATLFMPKALLPVGNKPVILFLLEELFSSSIKDVYLIINKDQVNIINTLKPIYSDNDLNKLISNFNFHYTIQNKQNGLARAIYLLKDEINEPFALLLSDNIILPIEYGIQNLIKKYKQTKNNTIGITKVNKSEISKYGIIESSDYNEPIIVERFIEKPSQSDSTYACFGRYILNPSIFKHIEKDINKCNELLLPNYIINDTTYAYLLNGDCLDVGTISGYVQASNKYLEYLKADIIYWHQLLNIFLN